MEEATGERDHAEKSCYCREQVPPASPAAPWRTSTCTSCATTTAVPVPVPAAQIPSQTENEGQNLILEEGKNKALKQLGWSNHPSCANSPGAQHPPPGHPGSALPFSLCAAVPALHQGLELPTVLLGLSSEETVLGLWGPWIDPKTLQFQVIYSSQHICANICFCLSKLWTELHFFLYLLVSSVLKHKLQKLWADWHLLLTPLCLCLLWGNFVPAAVTLQEEARQILQCHPQPTWQQSRLQGRGMESVWMGMIPSGEAGSLEAAWLSLIERKQQPQGSISLFSPHWNAGTHGRWQRPRVFWEGWLLPLHNCASTHRAPCTSLLFPCGAFNNPENGSPNIKYQTNTQNWCRFPQSVAVVLPSYYNGLYLV